jgi:predicted Zn finger-like uncharacterized protein
MLAGMEMVCYSASLIPVPAIFTSYAIEKGLNAMPIEFLCPQCQTRLRVSDDAAGKATRCPKCSNPLTVPVPVAGASVPHPVPAPPRPSHLPPIQRPSDATSSEINPYASPAITTQAPQAFSPLRPGVLDFGRVFSHTWDLYFTKQLLGWCILGVLISGLLQQAFNFVTGQFTPMLVGLTRVAPLIYGSMIVLFVAQLAFQQWLNIGLIVFMLRIARGGKADIVDLFRGGPYLLRGIGYILLIYLVMFGLALALIGIPAAIANLIVGKPDIGMWVGMVLMLFPMGYLGLAVSQVMYLYVDRNAGFLEAFQESFRLTRGNMLTLFLIFLVLGLAMFSGVIACVIGLILTVPFGVLGFTITYLHLASEEATIET